MYAKCTVADSPDSDCGRCDCDEGESILYPVETGEEREGRERKDIPPD